MRIGKGRSSSTTRLTVELRLNRIATKQGPTGLPHPIRRMPHMPSQRSARWWPRYLRRLTAPAGAVCSCESRFFESASPRAQLTEADGDIWTWEGLGTSSRQRKAGWQPAGSPAVRRMAEPLPRWGPSARKHTTVPRSATLSAVSVSARRSHRLIWPRSRCTGRRWGRTGGNRAAWRHRCT